MFLTFLPADVGQIASSASLAETESLFLAALVDRLTGAAGNCLRIYLSFPDQLNIQRELFMHMYN